MARWCGQTPDRAKPAWHQGAISPGWRERTSGLLGDSLDPADQAIRGILGGARPVPLVDALDLRFVGAEPDADPDQRLAKRRDGRAAESASGLAPLAAGDLDLDVAGGGVRRDRDLLVLAQRVDDIPNRIQAALLLLGRGRPLR